MEVGGTTLGTTASVEEKLIPSCHPTNGAVPVFAPMLEGTQVLSSGRIIIILHTSLLTLSDSLFLSPPCPFLIYTSWRWWVLHAISLLIFFSPTISSLYHYYPLIFPFPSYQFSKTPESVWHPCLIQTMQGVREERWMPVSNAKCQRYIMKTSISCILYHRIPALCIFDLSNVVLVLGSDSREQQCLVSFTETNEKRKLNTCEMSRRRKKVCCKAYLFNMQLTEGTAILWTIYLVFSLFA